MKGPFGDVYPYHHLHNQMLNGASNGLFRSGDQLAVSAAAAATPQQPNASHFASTANNNNSLHFPSAFVAFHNSQMAAAAAAAVGQQRPTQLESNFNPASSFHYPHGWVYGWLLHLGSIMKMSDCKHILKRRSGDHRITNIRTQKIFLIYGREQEHKIKKVFRSSIEWIAQ